jgi:hypothetical protein
MSLLRQLLQRCEEAEADPPGLAMSFGFGCSLENK